MTAKGITSGANEVNGLACKSASKEITPYDEGYDDFLAGIIPFGDEPEDYLAGYDKAKQTREMLKEVGW